MKKKPSVFSTRHRKISILHFSIRLSHHLKYYLILIHSISLYACTISFVSWTTMIFLNGLILLHLIYTLKKTNRQTYTIKYSDINGWLLWENNIFQSISILPSTVITSFVVLLHFKHKLKKYYLIITPSALAENNYRQLIIKLRQSYFNVTEK